MSDIAHSPREGASHPKPIPVAEARARIVEQIVPVSETESVALGDALHRILGATVVSEINVPGADNSSMDGYALALSGNEQSGDIFRQVGVSYAGHPFDGVIEAGQCVRIMTGAVVPSGANTVVMQENTTTTGDDSRITVDVLPDRQANIRPAGEDIARGDAVLGAGQHLGPADISLLASVGRGHVSVYRRPAVAFFSSGDELKPVDGPLQTGEIYDSNRHGLAAAIAEIGMIPVDLGVVPDDRDALSAAFDRAMTCDALITSGGVSVGDADLVLDVLSEKGEIDFWRVAIKPGKPLAFGLIGNTRFFGLPGNPVSTAVTFIQLVRPALVRMAGGHPAATVHFRLPTTAALNKRPGRAYFLRARMDFDSETPSVTPVDHQGSGVMRSMSRADAFIVLPAEAGDVAAGTSVVVEPFAQPVWAGTFTS